MCRFLAYQGPEITVHDLLYAPEHSLIKQSYQAHESDRPLNADGFGLGWYSPDITPEPARFVSVTPAWNNMNLKSLASHIRTPVVLAHVRRASIGGVAENNCHPFHYKNMLMMHNGYVDDFIQIKRSLTNKLSDERYAWVNGQTDSQHLFALFLDHYLNGEARGANAMAAAFVTLFQDLATLKQQAGLNSPSFLNMVITDGQEMVATRYVDMPDATPLSLHHAHGSHYRCDEHGRTMLAVSNQEHSANLIASEPLSSQAEHWEVVPANHFVLIDTNGYSKFVAIKV
ncbi:class II glutamine amidotransferase [Orrella sp. 11846]|uniref:class II glutamine amidotransferase n=1 Tax=Orrella sp. 11846 TaxID=3409913 RepID=UPI003B5A5BEC